MIAEHKRKFAGTSAMSQEDTARISSGPSAVTVDKLAAEDTRAIQKLREYIRIPTVHPDPNYEPAVAFLEAYTASVGLPFRQLALARGKPIVVVSVEGTQPELPSVLLNSHMDVVPVVPDRWRVDAFSAEVIDGWVYGRGTQDMKSIGIQYLEALARLRARGVPLKRTIHVTFMPDEECGGMDGMELFVVSDALRSMNVGVALDEGLATTGDAVPVFFGERKDWWVRLRSNGPAGHGSRFVESPAVDRLVTAATRMLQFRAEQKKAYEAGCSCGKTLGDFTTLNVTSLRAGVPGSGGMDAYNVVPTAAEAGVNIRVPVSVDLKEFGAQLDRWTSDLGVTWELVAGTDIGAYDNPVSNISSDSIWWRAFTDALRHAGYGFEPQVFPAATDSRFLRGIGLPCFGFSPLRRTPVLLHDHDERISVVEFLKGIQAYEVIIEDLASV